MMWKFFYPRVMAPVERPSLRRHSKWLTCGTILLQAQATQAPKKIDKLKKRLKNSRSQQLTSSSSSNEETDASFEEEVKGKRGRKGDKRSYNTTSFNYDNLPPSSAFTSVPIGKTPRFDMTDYTKWKYSMKIHLILFNLSV
jgi:hypothetical protein